MSDGDPRETLKSLLNAGLELRKRLFPQHSMTEETRALCNELQRVAGTARTLAVQMKHPHGQACAAELQLAGRLWMMHNAEENDEDEAVVERELEVAQGVAKAYGDVNLVLRVLELRAMLYNYTAETWKEVRVDELAVAIGGRTPQRVVSLVGAYWRLIEAANISLVSATMRFNDAEKKRVEAAVLREDDGSTGDEAPQPLESEEQAKLRQVILEHNIKCWDEIQWLQRSACDGSLGLTVNFDEFLRRYHVPVFAVCVFVGTVLANPYITEWKEKDVEASKRAFALAERVALLTDDGERLCTAVAYRVRTVYGRATAAEQEQLVAELKKLQQDKRPTGTDISDLLADIEKQRTAFGGPDASPEKAEELKQRIMSQLQQLQHKSSSSSSTEAPKQP